MAQKTSKNLFGTFGGVFTPCVLTILGVILFLRTGMVVGHAGLWHALIILMLGKTITVLTSISLSAIVTNTRVKGGGAYFLISRSLGPEFGGAIGLVFFLAQAISVALYVIGFSDALAAVTGYHNTKIIGMITVILLFISAYISAGWVVKIQYAVMAALLVSMVAFFAGSYFLFDFHRLAENLKPGYSGNVNFWLAFAIFFPAVTGVMAGANMSGDLKDPSNALPKGTFGAVFITMGVYIVTFICLAACASREQLQGNVFIFQEIALKGVFFVNMGIFCATLSSALGSFVGAPRILQALARDRIFPSLQLFGDTSGATQEPRKAVILTFIIAVFGILFFDLDLIAPVISMFFLLTYGMLNFAAFYETRSKNPSFRPTFHWYHWLTGLLGALGCFAVMFLINPLAALIATAVIYLLYRYIENKHIRANWGDVRAGYLFARVRDNLMKLEQMQSHPKNWRPKILVLSGNPKTRSDLVQFAVWLEGRRGLLLVSNIIVTDSFAETLPYLDNQKQSIKKFLRQNDFEGLAEVICAPDFEVGFNCLLQSAGIGELSANTVLLGLCEDEARYASYTRGINTCIAMHKNILVLKLQDFVQKKNFRSIDIWWRGKENGQLMLLYAFLLKQTPEWDEAEIRIMRIVKNEEAVSTAREHLKTLAQNARVSAKVEVIVDRGSPLEVIFQKSCETDIVFLGMGTPQPGEELVFAEGFQTMSRGLDNVIFVKCNMEMDIMV